MKALYNTVEEYFLSVPEQATEKLALLRQTIKQIAPDAVELISYNMPALKLHGRILVYYAGYKGHIGLYPANSTIIETFKKELTNYKTSKGTIQFPLDEDLPLELIGRIIKYRAEQNRLVVVAKKK